jgi:predicted glycogen debranching enzyme
MGQPCSAGSVLSSTIKERPVSEQAEIQFGRETYGDLAAAESREWLVTNGIGGYASGTIAGSQTRRYHGLLVAALQPPVGRTQLVSALDETAGYTGTDYSLATHRWASGALDLQGFQSLESFRLEGTTPVWTYGLADALLEKRIWMRQWENTTYIQYTLAQGSSPLDLQLKALVNYRDFHSLTHAGEWRMNIEPAPDGVKIVAFDGAVPVYLKSLSAACKPQHVWYRDFYFPLETERGLDDREDQLFAALFHTKLEPGTAVTIVATTEAAASLDSESALTEHIHRDLRLFQAWEAKNTALAEEAPSWIQQLILAADQFIVKRSLPEEPEGRSIIAGYHWFGDWGRDTMIALPGLALTTGRPDVAKRILLAFSRFVDGGMLPNNFPDAGGNPQYNTVDAVLWYFEAIRQYFEDTRDRETLQRLFPVLAGIIDGHLAGTRYNIHVDPADGLLYAGGPGVQLTWMDAKIGDWVVTPRTGKPVEINALWINALETTAKIASLMGKPSEDFQKRAHLAKKNFQRFWNTARGCCFDVIDCPGIGNDALLRPNQIFAVSLPICPLDADQQKSVVDICAQHLLTSHGLRSLAPGEPGYAGHYGGSPRDRDAVYHQGTVWGWLLGPFALAHYRVYRDREAALGFLEPLGRQIYAGGLGTLSEIFDGDAPFTPRGCIAQAWTVAEVLRVWRELSYVK